MAIIHEHQSNGVRVPNRGTVRAECSFDGRVIHIGIGTCDVQLSPAELADVVRAVLVSSERKARTGGLARL
jgi:hypothetical protein